MEKHRDAEDLNKNTKLTDAKALTEQLSKNTKIYMDAIKTANSEIASAQANLEINQKALKNLEQFLTAIDSSRNQLKYTSGGGIRNIDDIMLNMDSLFDDDEESTDSYGTRSSLVVASFRAEAQAYEEVFNAQRTILMNETPGVAAEIENIGILMVSLLEQMGGLITQMEVLRNKKLLEEEKLLKFRKTGEAKIDVERKKLEKKKMEFHQNVLDNKSVIENTNNIMKVYKANLDTDIKASYSEAAKKKMEEEEKPIKEKDRLTALKTLYDGKLLDETEYKNKKKEELEKEENLEIKKLKEKLTSLEKLMSEHDHGEAKESEKKNKD